MSTQRYISTSFWDDPWISELKPNDKLIYLYLMTNPLTNIAGVYELTVKRICFDTGLKANEIEKSLVNFQENKKAYRYGMYIILTSWPKHQKWEQRSKIKAGIENLLVKLDLNLLSYLKHISYTYPIDTLPIDHAYLQSYSELELDTDKDIESNKDIEVKNKYGKYERVLLTQKQFDKLVIDYGVNKSGDMIDNIDTYFQEHQNKIKNFSDHNLTMRKWEKNKPAKVETTEEELNEIWK